LLSRVKRAEIFWQVVQLPVNIRLQQLKRGLKIFWVNNLGTFTGRAVPVVGWLILAKDVAQISFRTVHRYNLIVRQEDKIW